ncbi:MAG TPA: prenyltransferase/squalene oxidase repeat-containing protein [Pirellulales bacterium]|jgi:squalene-hopene/tetraprenyl-beta-curcumene cyclase|nr:prenyltransferase/squalene oxidase repeat-containing protein [Pirellulales bacterium]
MFSCKSLVLFIAAAVLSGACSRSAEVALLPDTAQTYHQAAGNAVEYFRTKGQAADGSFSAEASPAITALVTTAILRTGRSPDDPLVAKSLKYLEGLVHPDGGIYVENSRHQNYETCIALQCFSAANQDKRYDTLLKNAETFVKNLQWDAGEQLDSSSANYGGAGYGSSKRPDLSNTSFLMDALKSVGRGPEDEAVQKALVFISRCQNLESKYNTTAFAGKNPDGGFYYTVSGEGASMAGKTPEGGLRSYGSMTYAGLKSMIYAGVGPNDPRVKAATRWIAQHYSLDENPGLGNAGLYYYYETYAKAMEATGTDIFVDAAGVKHDWRAELISALAKRQRPDGSWVNENNRWLEGDPNLVTGYALLALTHARPKGSK